MRYLLDTNIISFCMKGMYPSIIEHMKHIPAEEIGIPAIVYAELEFGACKSKNYNKFEVKIQKFLNAFQMVSFDEAAAFEYGKLRNELTEAGCIIGANDMLIASTALAENAILVTNNTKEFSRVKGLKVEDWTR